MTHLMYALAACGSPHSTPRMFVRQQVEWSSDSQYVLCAMFKVQTVQVVPVDMADDWTCSVCEGVVAGLVRARGRAAVWCCCT